MYQTIRSMVVAGMLLVGIARAELPPAAQVVEQTGVAAGLAVVVGTTDGKLEADLTRGGADKAAWVRVQTVAEFVGGLDKDGKPRTWNYQRIADQEPAAAAPSGTEAIDKGSPWRVFLVCAQKAQRGRETVETFTPSPPADWAQADWDSPPPAKAAQK